MSLFKEPPQFCTVPADRVAYEENEVEEMRHHFISKDTKANVFENDREFVIQVDLPGADPASIKTETKFNDNMIWVSADVLCPDSNNKFHLKERQCGKFSRTFSLNGISGIKDMEKVSFSQIYLNGVLEIKVMK